MLDGPRHARGVHLAWPCAARGERFEHGLARASRPAGPQRLPAGDPRAERALDRLRRSSRRARRELPPRARKRQGGVGWRWSPPPPPAHPPPPSRRARPGRHPPRAGGAGPQPGASGPVPTELHGPISTGAKGNRVYLGYGTNKDGIMQIVDRAKLLSGPREPTPENLLAPQVGRFNLSSMNGAHTTLPVIGVEMAEFAKDKGGNRRDFVVVVNESLLNECLELRQMAFIVDVTDEKVPVA